MNETSPAAAESPGIFEDLPHHQPGKHRYSLLRATRMASEGVRRAGLEGEVSAEIARRSGRTPRGLFVPWDVPLHGSRSLSTSGTSGAGAVATVIPPGTLWDALRAKLVMARMGAKVGSFGGDARGKVAIPVKKSTSVISWVSEGSPGPSESNMTIAQAFLDPHTATAYTDATRWMESLGGQGFDMLVADDLVQSVAVAVDAAALNGPGNSYQPLGLWQMTGWPVVKFAADSGNGGKPDYGTLVAMESMAGQLCADTGAEVRMGWVTSPQGRSALRRCDLGGATTTGRYAWKARPCFNPKTGEIETVESVLGFPAISTINAPANLAEGSGTALTALAMGNFAHVLIQLWGAADVLRDPFKQSTNGVVRYRVYQDCDVAFMYPGVSFVVAYMLTS